MLPQRRGDLVNECLAGNQVELNDCLMYFSILPTNLTSKDFFALIYSFVHLLIDFGGGAMLVVSVLNGV